MPLSNVDHFGQALVRGVRDEVARRAALYAAGRYAADHPVARLWRHLETEEQRKVMALAILTTVDATLVDLMGFLEVKIGSGEIAIHLKSDATEYVVSENDMLMAWFDNLIPEHGEMTPDELTDEIMRLELERP